MSTKQKKVLITGATGFIGQHCLPRLIARNFEVHATSSKKETPIVFDGVQWHHINLLDSVACQNTIVKILPTHLLHLAWIAQPGVFWASNENLHWLIHSLELVQTFCQNGGLRVVGVGSCAEYEWGHSTCIENHTPLKPSTIYGRCKLAMSLALEAAADAYGISAVWARLFFPYGPGEPRDRLIPTVILGQLQGQEVRCTHGRQFRDFIFVEDVADALVTLLDSSTTGSFNIGTGIAQNLLEVVATVSSQLGRPDVVRFGSKPAPDGDPERVVADISRLKQEVGWQPKITLQQGIERTIEAWRPEAGLTSQRGS